MGPVSQILGYSGTGPEILAERPRATGLRCQFYKNYGFINPCFPRCPGAQKASKK